MNGGQDVSSTICPFHSGHEAELKTLRAVNKEQWSKIDMAHSRIDGIKNWVIAGMTSIVIQLVVIVAMAIFIIAQIK